MINTMINSDIQHLIHKGHKKAESSNDSVLVSSVSTIETIDPFTFYNSGASQFTGSRFFWADFKREVIYVGLGRATSLEPTTIEDRFQSIDEAWQHMTRHAIVSEDAPGYTGPMLFGGFNFDPLKQTTSLWASFPHTLFVVPQIMLTIAKGQAWLTINNLITSQSSLTDDYYHRDFLHKLNNITDKIDPPELANILHQEDIAPSQWMSDVERVTASIQSGELDKVVLARELRLFADQPIVASAALERLYTQQRDSYIFAFEHGDESFIGATPERLVKKEGEQFLSTCLAGSFARGNTTSEDVDFGVTLLQDDKNLLEHALAVKMIRNAMSEVCLSIEMPEQPILLKLKDIQHLYTPVAGKAREGASLLKAVEALHPTPALGGYPPQEAVEMIREVEQLDRGWYAAPIGWINRHQDGEFAVAIRSALIQGSEASLFAGCGIMGESDPLSEYNETTLKFRPMLTALDARVDSAEDNEDHQHS